MNEEQIISRELWIRPIRRRSLMERKVEKKEGKEKKLRIYRDLALFAKARDRKPRVVARAHDSRHEIRTELIQRELERLRSVSESSRASNVPPHQRSSDDAATLNRLFFSSVSSAPNSSCSSTWFLYAGYVAS